MKCVLCILSYIRSCYKVSCTTGMAMKLQRARIDYSVRMMICKTLDSVWQYIKAHSDKEVLIKTLKIELEDNIGMCAQGNLTRLCNVLQGYLDEMPKPSVAEILGDLLPPLMAIKDRKVRREKALQIMRTHNVPDEEQDSWLEGLDEDDDDGDEIRRNYLDDLRMDYYPHY